MAFYLERIYDLNNLKANMRSSRWTEVPFAPRRWPFFYGWVMVGVATLGTIASIPGQTIGVGVFSESLIRVLGRSRMELAGAYMVGTVASSFLLPWAGTLTDRLGVRVMVVASSLGLSLSLILFSFAHLIPRITSTAILSLGLTALLFMLIRFFGQGCLTMISRVAMARWFNHRRGLATGIANVLVAYTFNASPAWLNDLVQSMGWRGAYLVLAGATGVGMTVIGWVFYRDNPEQCGLIMDGRDDGEWVAGKTRRVPEVTRQYTRSEAARTSAFWVYAVANAWQALFMTAVAFHITSMGAEFGLTRAQSYAVFPYIGLVSVGAAVLAGWISDYIRLRWLIQITIACQVLAAVGLMNFSHTYAQALFITGYGISAGLFGLLLTIVGPRFFGRQHLGAISGLTSSILVFASALGPFLFSAMHDFNSSYQPVLILSAFIPVLLFIPALGLKNPQTGR
jgi:MFS transporter, OFA family, oxalate/formate antiporter